MPGEGFLTGVFAFGVRLLFVRADAFGRFLGVADGLFSFFQLFLISSVDFLECTFIFFFFLLDLGLVATYIFPDAAVVLGAECFLVVFRSGVFLDALLLPCPFPVCFFFQLLEADPAPGPVQRLWCGEPIVVFFSAGSRLICEGFFFSFGSITFWRTVSMVVFSLDAAGSPFFRRCPVFPV